MSDEWEQKQIELTARAEALQASKDTNPNYEAEKTALKTEAVMLAIDIANGLIAALNADTTPPTLPPYSHDLV